jgi:hypothetical protein
MEGVLKFFASLVFHTKRGPMRTGIVQRAAAAGSAAYRRVYAAQSRWYRPMHHD